MSVDTLQHLVGLEATAMSSPLAGKVVALAETRQLEELAQLLEKEGAVTLRCPLVGIFDAPHSTPVVEWLRRLVADEFSYVVFFTGEGIRRLLGFAERAQLRAGFINALGRTKIISRGPKPVRALKELGLAPYCVAEAPTTAGVIATLEREPITGQIVGVQNYRDGNPVLEDFLASRSATVAAVVPYVYAPAAHADRVVELIQRLAAGTVDALILTSSPQIDRLYDVAAEKALTAELAAGLMRTRVAAIGPVVAENLRQRGARVHICPEQGFVMKNLVKHIKEDMLRTAK